MRLWPDSLAGRTLALLIGMTLLLTAGSAILLHDERKERFDERSRFRLLDKVSTLVGLLNDADADERRRIIKRFAERGDDISLSGKPLVEQAPRHPLEHRISHKLLRTLEFVDPGSVRVTVAFDRHDRARSDDNRPDRKEWESRHPRARVHDLEEIAISVRLADDLWLNMRKNSFEGPPPWAVRTLQLLGLLLILLIFSGLLIARRMARPMSQLAEAADRIGLGHSQAPLPENGPREVRQTIRAFNRMQERLHKHITDRSRMLAAVSHDLRTPITVLRLRAEYISDPEIRKKTLGTLAEMESVLSAALSFARDEAADEEARSTDLAALLSSLVDDHLDLGGDVSYQGPDRSILICRPVSLKRALNNLIDNALKYGNTAGVRLNENPEGIEILVDDCGPGIPEEHLENVFSPFFRLEDSRNRETGGTGLGLAVARTIVHAHGGQLHLVNRHEGGVRAVMSLPG